MKIEIETYKDQLIEYDLDSDKFVCDISIEDKSKSTKRQSLRDVRKEIDNFIKLNLEFKPFRVLFCEYGTNVNEYNVKAIRSNKFFVVESIGGWKSTSYIPIDQMGIYKKWEPEILELQNKLSEEISQLQIKKDRLMKEAIAKLKPIDLSKYE